jgi:hypothetical protein
MNSILVRESHIDGPLRVLQQQLNSSTVPRITR